MLNYKVKKGENMKSVDFDQEHIYINGKTAKIMSGSMHYFRVHPDYWRDRLLKLKELGCNCVETYTCWNLHEKREGELDFSGWLDVGAYLDMAKELGLYAVVRPGPYICSEWEFGGLPWWLLKYPRIEPRSSQPLFLEKCASYLRKVCDILRPRLISQGGNVIFVQIENEYGSYGNDREYLKWLKAFYENNGIDCGFITSDGDIEYLLHNGTLPDVLASVDYRWDSVKSLGALQKFHGGQPGAVMELWNGKAEHVGEAFVRRDLDEVARSVETALDNAEFVNLYMFHGGTTFGFMNGTQDLGKRHVILPTSYDVDAPVDEYGRRTLKYYAEQKVICEKLGKAIENTAKDPVLREYRNLHYTGECSLSECDMKIKKISSASVLSMEDCDQGYGYIVYATTAYVGPQGAYLMFPNIHDIAHVYVDGVYVRTLMRYDTDYRVEILEPGDHKIEILVENLGRGHYGARLKDRKGLDGDMDIYDIEHNHGCGKMLGWDHYCIPLDSLPQSYHGKAVENSPAFYQYVFEAEETGDTILRMDGFTRGVAFLNGFNLGRYWSAAHTRNKLFIPAPLMRKGMNEIVIFDVLAIDKPKSVRLTDR